VSAPLRGDVILNCGFKQQEIPLAQEVSVEWRLQHRGKGGKVFEMMTRLDEAEGSTVGECCRKRSDLFWFILGLVALRVTALIKLESVY